ncbi:MAG: hypothetical protein NC388_00095 [Clostridium sp.]|nr:hypothetical protein [Clostridium sp.]
MKTKNIIYGLIGLSIAVVPTSCIEDDTDDLCTVCPQTENEFKNNVLILNQGCMGTTDASLTLYNSATHEVTTGLFASKNEASLGDTGQDMILADDQVYISATGADAVYRVGRCGLLKATYTKAGLQPRSLTAKDGKLYVSTYEGKVIRINTATMQAEATTEVAPGVCLEGIALNGNTLYVAKGYTKGENFSFTYHNTLEAVDATTMEHLDSYTVGVNPQDVKMMDGRIYVICLGDYDTTPVSTLGCLEPGRTPDEYITIVPALKMAMGDHKVYYCTTDWLTGLTTFGVYYTQTQTISSNSPLQPSPEVENLARENVQMMEVDPHNGDLYIGTTDYWSQSTIYRFDRTGAFITSFTTGGPGACRAVFL